MNTAGVMGYGCETKNKYKIKNSLGQVTPPLPLLYSIQEPGRIFFTQTRADFLEINNKGRIFYTRTRADILYTN